jgi:hypothetical protein
MLGSGRCKTAIAGAAVAMLMSACVGAAAVPEEGRGPAGESSAEPTAGVGGEQAAATADCRPGGALRPC